MSRRFMIEAETLSKRMYHAGEPALRALVYIEAGEDIELQANVLFTRVRTVASPLLHRFARYLREVYTTQRHK